MLNRRLMLTGGLLAPAVVRVTSIMPIRVLTSRIIPAAVAPAIVAPNSLMPVSPIEQPLRWIARVRYRQGGTATVIGEAPFDDWHEFPTLINDMVLGRIPWGGIPDTIERSVEVHILRADESALTSELFTGR